MTNFSEFVGQVSPSASPFPHIANTQKKGGGNPKDARPGTNSLARVLTVSSRDSGSHHVLLVSRGWQEMFQGILR